MFNPTEILIEAFQEQLRASYRAMFGDQNPDYPDIIAWAAGMALEQIANSDALYHNVDHTVLVTAVGQEILRGKHLREGGVRPRDWLLCLISLLCHDIGFVRGICRLDRPELNQFATGQNDELVTLPAGCSDASLNPYHVERGKQFIRERFAQHPLIDADVITHNIEFTRFPVPEAADYQDTRGFPGLIRAADLIGQFSDLRYLNKLVALYYEFEETGTNRLLGYHNPGEMRQGYPQFYWKSIYPWVTDALRYLSFSQYGKQIVASLYAHVFVMEHAGSDVGESSAHDLPRP
jgi:hypothetical protein